MAIFRTYCKNKITEKKIRPEHITNMDEVPLTFDIPVNRTVEKTGTPVTFSRRTARDHCSVRGHPSTPYRGAIMGHYAASSRVATGASSKATAA
ncbi:hypothetical protein AAFF_G00337920 [Aldrovandia affinis]|uniref:Uncharacterized protein n=1 Tax=Aldrovandia affinis TaxID=143900 RepID=A0AAD7SKW6_9TELE|nr:hypothetical protein AAFF_G00337920 [Aldrovandia affinis]